MELQEYCAKNEANLAYERFNEIYTEIFNTCFPECTSKSNSQKLQKNEWITNGMV